MATGCATGGLREKAVELPEVLPTDVDVAVQWWSILGDEFSEKAIGTIAPQIHQGVIYTGLVQGDVLKVSNTGSPETL